MNISIIGSGNIGQTEAKLLAKAGHSIMFGSRTPQATKDKLEGDFQTGTFGEASQFSTIILVAIPWTALEETANELAPTKGKIIIDATNPFGRTEKGFGLQPIPNGKTALQHTMQIFPEAHVVKSFNTLTAGFQFSSAGRTGADRVVMPLAGDDEVSKKQVADLIEEMGFDPYDVGDSNMSKFIEPPRNPYSLYGEEWHLSTIKVALDRLQDGKTHSE